MRIVRYVEDDDEYALTVADEHAFSVEDGTVHLSAGGLVMIDMSIDSGASCNVVDQETWEDLKRQGIKCTSEKGTFKNYPYGSTEPLSLKQSLSLSVETGNFYSAGKLHYNWER